ncbi:MAG: NAD-dependent epimerase/dehydratase family protein [Acidobacteria bacterium]|nr:NAD-dependent epimerase/dehydratase family protein [Acidobacteriota bacterium]
MKIFLTGASGYVGSTVAEKLKGRGYEVAGLARTAAAAEKLRARKIEPVSGSLEDFGVLKDAAGAADAVVHTAFSHNFDDYDDAVRLDREVIKAFAGALAGSNKPLIVTSSSAVLGDTRGNRADEDYPFAENSPRRLRGESERDTLQLSARGIRSIVVRLPLFVYGRGGSSFVPFVINQAKAAGAAVYAGTGEQRVSAVHVDDAAALYLLALETSTAKGLYNAAAEAVKIKALNEAAARLLGVKTRSLAADEARARFGKMYDFLSIDNELDAGRARRELGWTPSDYYSILDDIENGSYRPRALD